MIEIALAVCLGMSLFTCCCGGGGDEGGGICGTIFGIIGCIVILAALFGGC